MRHKLAYDPLTLPQFAIDPSRSTELLPYIWGKRSLKPPAERYKRRPSAFTKGSTAPWVQFPYPTYFF